MMVIKNLPGPRSAFLTVLLAAILSLMSSFAAYAQDYSSPGCFSIPFGATRSMAMDANGDVVVTGCRRNANYEYDILTVKYRGTDGAILWATLFGGEGRANDGGAAVAIDSAGDVIVTGYAVNSAFKQSIRTIKYSGATGSELWNVSLDGGFGAAQAYAIALDGAGNVFVTGQSYDSDLNGYLNMRTIKYRNSTGEILWNVMYNGTVGLQDVAYSIAVDASGNAFITGYSGDTGEGSNLRIIKYDGGTGAEMWTSSFDDGSHFGDGGMAVALDATGNPVVAGYNYNTITQLDYRIIKYDGGTGDILWNTSIDGLAHAFDQATAVAIDNAGNVVITGHSTDAVGGSANARTIKYSGTTGAELWNAAYDEAAQDDSGRAVLVDSADDVLVAGDSSDALGFTQFRVLKYSGSTGALLWSSSLPPFPDLTVIRDGNGVGTVSTQPARLLCGSACTTSYTPGAAITLFADPTPGSVFSGWTGCDSVAGTVCTITALNASRTVHAAFNAIPISFTGVVSRKVHGAAGTFDLAIDTAQAIAGAVTVEPRAFAFPGHDVVFQFTGTVTATGPITAVDSAGAPVDFFASFAGNEVTVELRALPDNRRVTITVPAPNSGPDVSASLGFLVGDVNGTGSVNSSDISGVKARSGQTTDSSNFRHDVNTSGAINSSDISAIKARSGHLLNP